MWNLQFCPWKIGFLLETIIFSLYSPSLSLETPQFSLQKAKKAIRFVNYVTMSHTIHVCYIIPTSTMNKFKVYQDIPSRKLTYPPKNGILKMIFLFPRWDMLIPWRVDFRHSWIIWVPIYFPSKGSPFQRDFLWVYPWERKFHHIALEKPSIVCTWWYKSMFFLCVYTVFCLRILLYYCKSPLCTTIWENVVFQAPKKQNLRYCWLNSCAWMYETQ